MGAADRMRTAQPGEINYHAFDRFTLGHVLVGVGLAAVGTPFWGAAVFGVGWEIVERPMRVRGYLQMLSPESYLGQDTAENALWDAMAVMAGWWLAATWKAGRKKR
jgi:hypothetical protein